MNLVGNQEYFSPDFLYGKDKINLTLEGLSYIIEQIPGPVRESLELLYQNYNLALEESQSVHELSILLLHLTGGMIAKLNHYLMSESNINFKEVQNQEMFSMYVVNERIFTDRKTMIRLRIHNSFMLHEDPSVD